MSVKANNWRTWCDHKRSIIETKGSGLAFFDYDNDGWLDIYLSNGSRLDAHWPPCSSKPCAPILTFPMRSSS
jgi:hypothetical protein